mgnify:CR=1 FL=1
MDMYVLSGRNRKIKEGTMKRIRQACEKIVNTLEFVRATNQED